MNKNYIVSEEQLQRIIENIEPSKTAVKNICDSEKFCKAQGKITFGQLRAIVDSATKKRLFKHVGEGGIKATIRILPWFVPQLFLPGMIAASVRAINKILAPSLTETENYKTFWGKAILKSFKVAEGEINLSDPLSKIFFISDGLLTMMDDKYKVKFAKHIANLAANKPNDEEVPDYFVENELRKWVNDKFLLNPPIPPKISDSDDDDSIDWEKDDEEIKEDKSAKKQFRKDLQTDPDFIKFKKDSVDFGVPNVSVKDDFIKKRRYTRVGKNDDLFEQEEETKDETSITPDFFKNVYNPDDKSIVGAYTIYDETDKMVELLNVKETLTQKGIYMDGAEPYNIKIHKVKLPKSQIEILGPVEGKEGFQYIKIPYWLFKKQSDDLSVKRYPKLKRITFNQFQYKDNEFLKSMSDPKIIEHLVSSNPDEGLTKTWTHSVSRRYNPEG
jgi:hypothetical protein